MQLQLPRMWLKIVCVFWQFQIYFLVVFGCCCRKRDITNGPHSRPRHVCGQDRLCVRVGSEEAEARPHFLHLPIDDEDVLLARQRVASLHVPTLPKPAKQIPRECDSAIAMYLVHMEGHGSCGHMQSYKNQSIDSAQDTLLRWLRQDVNSGDEHRALRKQPMETWPTP